MKTLAIVVLCLLLGALRYVMPVVVGIEVGGDAGHVAFATLGAVAVVDFIFWLVRREADR